MSKIHRISRKIILVFITLIFLATGMAKLAGNHVEISMFNYWGYPLWLMYATGFLDILGAIGLHIKKVSHIAAMLLAVLLLAAMMTTVHHHEGLTAALPALAILLSLVGVFYLDTIKK